MANIFDYIDRRGDLDLTQDPFNEVDSLILSTVSYIDFELIETDLKTEKATIREAGEQFNRLHADEKNQSRASGTGQHLPASGCDVKNAAFQGYDLI